MKRRVVLAFLGTALAAPVALLQSSAADAPRIGILDPGLPHLFEAFFSGMRDFGYNEGQNIVYIRRSSEGRSETLSRLASELAETKPDVIVTGGPAGVRAAMLATSTIPIIFAALGDALATGVVTNLARPDRNSTGFSFLNTEISAKRMELLHEAAPNARRVAVLRDRMTTGADVKPTLQAAEAAGLQAQIFEVTSPDEYEGAFSAAIAAGAEAVDVLGPCLQYKQGAIDQPCCPLPAASDVRSERICPFGRTDVLRGQLGGPVSPVCRLRRQSAARCETSEPAGRTAH